MSSFVVGGVVGALGAGWFSGYVGGTPDPQHLRQQLLGVNVACGWSFGLSFAIYSSLRRFFNERLILIFENSIPKV